MLGNAQRGSGILLSVLFSLLGLREASCVATEPLNRYYSMRICPCQAVCREVAGYHQVFLAAFETVAESHSRLGLHPFGGRREISCYNVAGDGSAPLPDCKGISKLATTSVVAYTVQMTLNMTRIGGSMDDPIATCCRAEYAVTALYGFAGRGYQLEGKAATLTCRRDYDTLCEDLLFSDFELGCTVSVDSCGVLQGSGPCA
ncbi:uncharacterized protein L969DRAFT_22529 [Mixia osmundae IAM 14324]|uniref:uncharacterized protein n=1 Tax=Mixia osmundae (strain CBS 9802 / IAM 14324 / JCM 22182 / KY 12970) TaxID=764103 RepID=UPI0004A552A3|nr:uncharacterized protein L969DRAFT_22529 [Mixia osmundae IAM 14324]KEI40572.1 hypothetical protein L969DRAFT_22529 [Mixia osmundae IAM 14324]